MPNLVTSSRIEALLARAQALRRVRHFFDKRGLIEVDVPSLSRYAAVDPYIDLIETKEGGFLHSSPEYALKRLICEGMGDVYFLGHVFRQEEFGQLHNAEFTMIEWYRVGMSEERFIEEVCDLIFLFLGRLEVEMFDFETALHRYTAPIPENVDTSRWSDDEKLFYTWAMSVEPHLGQGKLTIITNFRPEHAALAKTHLVNGQLKAKRYEFYYRGIELANGFDELCDPEEQEKRFIAANALRKKIGKSTYPIDRFFLDALRNEGLPNDTFGMAAGFDRLLMLALEKEHLSDVLPFSSDKI